MCMLMCACLNFNEKIVANLHKKFKYKINICIFFIK